MQSWCYIKKIKLFDVNILVKLVLLFKPCINKSNEKTKTSSYSQS